MNARIATIKKLVADGVYPIDANVVAEAIVVRSKARRLLPDVTLRAEPCKPEVRSFRPHRGARSFRLVRAQRRPSDARVMPVFAAHGA